MEVGPNQKIVIYGITKEGSKFRPSDWAERLGGQLSSVVNQRIKYSNQLMPGVREGHKCILLCPTLKQSNRPMYLSVLKFARHNHLKVTLPQREIAGVKVDKDALPRR